MKLSTIEKILIFASLIMVVVAFVPKLKESEIVEVKIEDVETRLSKLSFGLKKSYDDMKELRYYFSPIGEDMQLLVTPYVVIDKNYSPVLCEHLQYFGSHIIRFDTLYIKSATQVKSFKYSGAEIVDYNSEGYSGVMSNEVYIALKTAINSGYVRVRMEGNAGIEEKELSQKEIEGIKSVFEIYEYLSKIKVTK